MFLVTRVYCNDEYAPTPTAFVLEFDEGILDDFAEKSKAVAGLAEGFDSTVSAKFWGPGDWVDNKELGELLDDEDVVIVDKLPVEELQDAEAIRGHSIVVYANGDLIFESYQKYGNWVFESITVSINMLYESLQKVNK